MMDKEIIVSATAPGATMIPFMFNTGVIKCTTVNAVACHRMAFIYVLGRQSLTTKSMW